RDKHCQVQLKRSSNIEEHFNEVLLTNKLKNFCALHFRWRVIFCVLGFPKVQIFFELITLIY
ncbi:hypothetical protein scyTo_0008322, partial [Scyliorhinus torazame]|nr:hypothetical protein [Scyliorhinus torazame]